MNHGGLELLIKLASRDTNNKCVENMAHTLLNLSKNDDLAHSLIEGKALMALQLLALDSESRTLPVIAHSLTKLAKSDDGRTAIVEGGWLEQFRDWAESPDKELRLQTAHILSHVVENDQLALSVIRALGLDFFVELTQSTLNIDIRHTVERLLARLKNGKRPQNSNYLYVVTEDLRLK